MNVAGTFRRMLAHAIDEILGMVFLVPLIVSAFAQMGKGHSIVISWKLFFACWLSRMAYEVICIYMLQALPAQAFLGLRILSTYHPEMGIGLSQTVIRVLFAQFKYILGPSIFLMALLHRDRQHLGDILAETRVVQIQERAFTPKPRWVLGSILIFMSLVVNLGEATQALAHRKISKEGIVVGVPPIGLEFKY
ncbi:MAG: hypothetical protein RJB66_1563 [Pseudomonadota bacterium]|jgi:uncharacterized RDD family membrane protein YckC